MKSSVCLCLIGIIQLCRSQSNRVEDDRGLLFNRRPILGGGGAVAGGGSPCGGEDYDFVNSDERSLFAVLGGAAVGGVIGGAAGYHLGMKNQKPVVINNNVYNQLPSPCYSIPVHVTTGGGGGGGSGGGIIGGLLSNHPILSSILQGNILGGGIGGIGGRAPNRGVNRNIRQFNRQVIRPISRVFK